MNFLPDDYEIDNKFKDVILYIDDGYFVWLIFDEKFNLAKFVLNASYKHPTKQIFFEIDEETINKLHNK